jgi:hypothetical protein
MLVYYLANYTASNYRRQKSSQSKDAGNSKQEGIKGPRAPRPRLRNGDVPSGLHTLTERGAYIQGYVYIFTNETGATDAVGYRYRQRR